MVLWVFCLRANISITRNEESADKQTVSTVHSKKMSFLHPNHQQNIFFVVMGVSYLLMDSKK